MFCPKCGTDLPESAKFCSKCGNVIDKSRRVKPSNFDSNRKPDIAAGVSGKAAIGLPKGIAKYAVIAVILVVAVFLIVNLMNSGSADKPADGKTTSGQTQSIRSEKNLTKLFELYPYEKYVDDWAKAYKHLDKSQVESVVTRDVYERLVVLEYIVSCGVKVTENDIENAKRISPDNVQGQAEANAKFSYEGKKNEYDKALKDVKEKLAALQDSVCKPANDENVRVDDFKFTPVLDEAGNPVDGIFNVTGTIVNDSGYSLLSAMVEFQPSGTSTEYDKYGKALEPQVLSGAMQVDDLSGNGCFNADKSGIKFVDLEPGDSRPFSCMIGMPGYFSKLEKSDGWSMNSSGNSGPDLDIKGISAEIDDMFVPLSEQERLDIEHGDQIGKGVLLDPNVKTYHPCHGQVDIVVDSVTIDDSGKASALNLQCANNTGMYLDNVKISYAFYRGAALEKLSDGVQSHREMLYKNDRTFSAIAPGKAEKVSLSLGGNDIVRQSTGGKSLPAGDYKPEELGFACEIIECSYELDVNENIKEGLLPSNWKELSEYSKELRRDAQLLFSFLSSAASTFTAWAEENPEEAVDLLLDVYDALTPDGRISPDGEIEFYD